MPFPITLDQASYEALISLARTGAKDPDKKRQLEAFLVNLETAAGITRYFLFVRWQDLNYPLPPTTRFPEVWPPSLELQLQRVDRPIARADVNAALITNAQAPTNVMVTLDPGGIVGWTQLAAFFAAK